jgi:hypothetical protein
LNITTQITDYKQFEKFYKKFIKAIGIMPKWEFHKWRKEEGRNGGRKEGRKEGINGGRRKEE